MDFNACCNYLNYACMFYLTVLKFEAYKLVRNYKISINVRKYKLCDSSALERDKRNKKIGNFRTFRTFCVVKIKFKIFY